jgi:Tfp pilus assembly protein FimT
VTRRRPAYTLFELVLTTAVIAITAAVTVPSIDGMYPSYKLNASVDAVRAAWAQGRAHAIEEGRPYRFAVTPGTGSYRLAADDSVADGGQASDSDQSSTPAYIIQERLPQGVSFALAQEDGQQQQTQASSDGLSTVAVFLPDGTARDDAEVRFQVKGALPKTVKLRGLTGAVTVHQEGGGGAR